MGYAGFFVQNPARLHNRLGNATFRKRSDIKTAFTNAGDTLEYLPSYSPVFNHIEPKWVHAKAIRRREGCSVEQFFAVYEI
jgi:transposase